MRGETATIGTVYVTAKNFNPLSPCGERQSISLGSICFSAFQSTLPMRGETKSEAYEKYLKVIFQSTLPMRGETFDSPQSINDLIISIHSPHAGRDDPVAVIVYADDISIHSPHAGRDPMSPVPVV